MKSTNRLLFIFIICFTSQVFAGKIVYPWRATSAIVKAGETFEVWHSADENQTLNSVMLRGPYNVEDAAIAETKTEKWVYDQWSGNTCNRKYIISVPANTPTDRYDLILKTSSGDEISLAAVKVIKEYKNSFYVFHTTNKYTAVGDSIGAHDGLAVADDFISVKLKLPTNTTHKSVKWVSSNPAVASINSDYFVSIETDKSQITNYSKANC